MPPWPPSLLAFLVNLYRPLPQGLGRRWDQGALMDLVLR